MAPKLSDCCQPRDWYPYRKQRGCSGTQACRDKATRGWRQRLECCVYKPGDAKDCRDQNLGGSWDGLTRRTSGGSPVLPIPRSPASNLQSGETVSFCCWNHPVCATWLQQPWEGIHPEASLLSLRPQVGYPTGSWLTGVRGAKHKGPHLGAFIALVPLLLWVWAVGGSGVLSSWGLPPRDWKWPHSGGLGPALVGRAAQSCLATWG